MMLFLKPTLVFVLLALSGCVVQPVPLSTAAINTQADADLQQLNQLTEPVAGPITLHEAMARALAGNLDLQLEHFKTRMADEQLRVTRHDQLPDMVAGHVADGRSNFSGGVSRSLLTGRQSLESSTSSDRHTRNDDLGLSWNILDFGVSYFRARQAADRVLLASEQERNVVNRILTEVQQVYWRAVSYQRLVERFGTLDEKISAVLDASAVIEERGLSAPLDALMQRRTLLDNKRELLLLQEGLISAKLELAALMNLPPGTAFRLVDDRPTSLGSPVFDLAALETMAMTQRSELREVTYQKRINANEIKASYVQLLPGIDLNYGHNYSSNSLLFNADWTDYSARISWNLLDLLSLPATRSLSRAQAETLDAQRLALGAAILTQVHVSAARLQHARNEYLLAADLLETQRRIVNQLSRAVTADSASEQALIAEQVHALLAMVRYDIAWAELESARAELFAALGLHPSLDDLEVSDLDALTDSLRQYEETRWDAICCM